MTARAWRAVAVIGGALLLLGGVAVFVYLRPASRTLSCAGYQVSAYGSAGTFFIPGYAPPPELGSPSACLDGVRQALAAGLHAAAPPAGGRLVGDAFYLVPAGEEVRQGCREAATRLHFAVPCPELIPMHRAPVTCPARPIYGEGCALSSDSLGTRLDTFRLAQGDMIVPDSFTGNGTRSLYGRGTLIVAAGRGGSPPWAPWKDCTQPGGSSASGPAIGGQSSTWVTCPIDFAAGHTLLRWSRGDGVTCTVNLDGTQAITRQVVLAVAEHLRYVTS